MPMWNHFKTPLVKGVMQIANTHLDEEGFLVTLSLAQHLDKIIKYGGNSGMHLHCLWTLMCDGRNLHADTGEHVCIAL